MNGASAADAFEISARTTGSHRAASAFTRAGRSRCSIGSWSARISKSSRAAPMPALPRAGPRITSPSGPSFAQALERSGALVVRLLRIHSRLGGGRRVFPDLHPVAKRQPVDHVHHLIFEAIGLACRGVPQGDHARAKLRVEEDQ